jgi:NMD protein affecting ribosome stability and mRNA decay
MKGLSRVRVQDRNTQDTHDPYYNQSRPKDPSYCKACHAIYHNKHWHFDEREFKTLQSGHSNNTAVYCPACRKIQDKFASGIVTLKGDFVRRHREEIINLVKNEEKRAMGLNPLERLIEVSPSKEGLQITTTHEKLAQRIGKRLHRSFRGNVAYQWTPQDKMARVSWDREE